MHFSLKENTEHLFLSFSLVQTPGMVIMAVNKMTTEAGDVRGTVQDEDVRIRVMLWNRAVF